MNAAGLTYQQDFITPEEESALLGHLAALPLEEAKYKAYRARRRTASFGSSYDFETHVLGPAPALPAFLLRLRERAAGLAALEPAALAQALVTEYRPGTELGWHRDVPQYGIIVGVSLGASCRMRFRRYPPQPRARAYDLELEPRSVYVLRDEIRWGWQHSIAATPALRYSITFRSLR